MIQDLEAKYKEKADKKENIKYEEIDSIIGKENDENSILGGLTRIIDYASIDSSDIKAKSQLQIGAVYNKVTDFLLPIRIISKPAEPTAETKMISDKTCLGKAWESEVKEVIEKLKLSGKVDKTLGLFGGYDSVYLIESLISYESSGKEKDVSPQGAVGLMQLMPATAKALGLKVPDYAKVTENGRTYYRYKGETISEEKIKKDGLIDERFDAKKNIEAGTRYLLIDLGGKENIKNALGRYIGTGSSGDVFGTTSETYYKKILEELYPVCAGTKIDTKDGECILTSADWNVKESFEGEKVELTVKGDNCDGEEVQFIIQQSELPLLNKEYAKAQPLKAVFSGNKATSKWIAEYASDGLLQGSPEYEFIAKLEKSEKKSENELIVKRKEIKECEILQAKFMKEVVTEGNEVILNVIGENCEGVKIQFNILKSENPYSTSPVDRITEEERIDKTIVTVWTAENAIEPTEYVFRLLLNGEVTEIFSENSLVIIPKAEQKVQVISRAYETEVTLMNDIFFEYNSDVIKKENSILLNEELKKILSDENTKLDNGIIVLGYASMEGNKKYNEELSLKRADKIRKIIEKLFEELGRDAEITALGKGPVNIFGGKNAEEELKKIENGEMSASEAVYLALDRRVIIKIPK